MKYEQWIKILSAVNADGDLNQSNIIEKIKERLQRIDLSTFQDWKNDRFNINYKFTLYTGLASFKLTLLYLATKDGCKKVVEALISNGADVNTKDMNGLTPLYWAAKIGHKEVVNALIKAGAGVNINAKSKKEQTSLHRAAETGRTGAINALLAKGADIDAIDDNGETPLRLAIKNGHTKAVNALLEAEEFNINTSDGLWNYGWALLHCVIANDHKKIVEVLIASKASVNTKSENGWTPLHWAAENGYTDAINALLAAGADVDVRDCWLYDTPLHLAAENGHTDAVNALLAAEADVNLQNARGKTLLHWATKNAHKEIVEVLIASKASVNVKGENGWTPLHWAAVNGHTDTVNALLAAEADVNLQNTDGRTPLHLAAKRGHVEIVKALIDKGADVNKEDKYGQTPLHLAAECGQVEIVKALVDRGADIDKRDKKGGISLGFAVNNYHNRHYTNNDNHIKMVKILVGHIAKLETAGLHISQDNLQLKDSVQLEYNSDIASSYREGLRKYKEEIEKLTKEDKPLYDFLKESNINELASIWEKNKDIRNKFDNQKSLQRQYPEYAYTLINKANEIKKEIFLHNHEPLIDALSTHYRRDFQAMIFAGIENFFKVHKDDFRKELGNGGITLINFVDFENFAERHAPTLKVRAFAKVIENNLSSESPDDQNIDQACSSSVDEQVSQPVSETTGTIEHISASDSEHGEVSESDSTKIPVSDQANNTQGDGIQPSDDALQNKKKSKLPIVVASVLAVAGIISGIAIAVHLEMLAVGIAVGACCLVAAAIIYCCNEPSKSLEDSNVQGFSENHRRPAL
ncbi:MULTISPECIES: ankyrin repeat domain-containing protein [Wolbachia]|uniref:ankyrin repeat domain-containing protein n=1 Tax=Wolbachia TaxID=953 RepID=UPI0015FADF0D|nr:MULTISPECIES: ankyrin repeat domain-containing protein [Wolbachia]MBA8757360.1 hypothetical protein [Wolbachia pipientis]MDE5059153.1 ankyrin repeat domain-containing protein [Wolbachia endosymbiont of Drosophila baimaii]